MIYTWLRRGWLYVLYDDCVKAGADDDVALTILDMVAQYLPMDYAECPDLYTGYYGG